MKMSLHSLTNMSNREDMELFCKNLPKIELHAHLNGSLSKCTLKQLGCSDEAIIEEYGIISSDISTAFNSFKVAHQAVNSAKALYMATKNVIQEFSEDNVIYLELRTTPKSCGTTLSEDEYIETVVKVIHDLIIEPSSSKIMVKLILSIDRRQNLHDQIESMDRIIKYKSKYSDLIKGVDFSGDPAKGEFYEELFVKARKNGLKTTIHCAEIENIDEIRKILNFQPNRIGHGTCIHPELGGSHDIWEIYKKFKIPVECCLTSNVVCQTSKSYKDHHVKEWIKANLPFCLGTDDKGVFNTTLSKEFAIFSETHQFGKEQLYAISRNTVDYSFANEEEKLFLKNALNAWKEKH